MLKIMFKTSAMKKFLLPAMALIATQLALAQKHGIINNSQSPYVLLRSIDMGD